MRRYVLQRDLELRNAVFDKKSYCSSRGNLHNLHILTCQGVNTVWRKIDIQVWYSLVDINIAQTCGCTGKWHVTSWRGKTVCITSPLWGEFTVHRLIPVTKGPHIWCCDVSFDASLNKILNKQSRSRWNQLYWLSSEAISMTKAEGNN